MFNVEVLAAVYSVNPRSTNVILSLVNRYVPSATEPPSPICGSGMPVICIEMNIAGIVYAKISTQY